MKITLTLPSGSRLSVAPPSPSADHALIPGPPCLHCATTPLLVAGRDMRIAPDDRAYESAALSLCCRRPVGTLRAEPSTIFGVREDEAVLHGRCRVY